MNQMLTLENILKHDDSCGWYWADGDICNCTLPDRKALVKRWAVMVVGSLSSIKEQKINSEKADTLDEIKIEILKRIEESE
jgi:hypothetical protein